MPRRPALVLTILAVLLVGRSPVAAAELTGDAQADLRRAIAMVGAKTSDQPALREEGKTRPPSAAFALGAALGAWRGASALLAYDLVHPSGDGDDSEAIAADCFDEKTAFTHLESHAQALGLPPEQVVNAAGLADAGLLASWKTRRSGPPPRCR